MALKAAVMTSSRPGTSHQYSHTERYTPSPDGTSRGSPGPPIRAISTSPDLKENPIIRRRKVISDRKSSPRQRYSDVPANYQDHQFSPLLSQQRQEGSFKVCHLLSLQRRPSYHVSSEHDVLSLCDYDPCCIGWLVYIRECLGGVQWVCCTVLYSGCVVQCCTVGVLYSGVQWVCCTVLYSVLQWVCCTVVYSGCVVQCCTVLYSGVQWVCCTVLYSVVQCCTVVYSGCCMPMYVAAVPKAYIKYSRS